MDHSARHLPLEREHGAFRRVPALAGEARPLNALPAHLFEESEGDELECLLDLALLFFWDATLIVAGAAPAALRISHDEWFSIHARDEARLRAIAEVFAPFDLQRL